MKGLLILVLLAIIALAVFMAVRAVVRQQRLKNAKWELHEEETADSTEFWLVKGETADFMGRALRSLPSYNDKYFEIQSKAEEEMLVRNAANKVTKRLNT
jgi:hypothetical protein